MAKKKIFTPWSSLDSMLGKMPSWWPEDEQQRIAAYEKYDQMYWNDPTQYAIRVLENEQAIYIPNARTIVDTTAQYLLKGLRIFVDDDAKPAQDGRQIGEVDDGSKEKSPAQKFVDNFLTREKFYSKFHINKQAGISRGDWAFHITADPQKPAGERISIDTIHPGTVWRVTRLDAINYDDPNPQGDPDEVVRMHIVNQWVEPTDAEKRVRIRKLTYEKRVVAGAKRVWREEAIYELNTEKGFWWGPTPEKVRQILEGALLPPEISQLPIYWYNNIDWEGQLYGSSDLRGLEFLEWAVSQGATDTQAALALEGLGVYATDGGRPVDDDGNETDWEIFPGHVAEVPAGSYFRRVEGVGSITPMMDQLKYLESKMYAATGMTDVALGQVDVQVAQSGVALAIKFMPTLARIEHRDISGLENTRQMFHDLQHWYAAYEEAAFPEVDVQIDASKLPVNRVEALNELNNMIDRKIISRQYYRTELKKLGYNIPSNMDEEIAKEAKKDAELAALTAPPELQANAEAAAAGRKGFAPESDPNNGSVDRQPNRSNNRTRPNESSGTESGQTLRRQSKS
jgi:hypothetical protein